MVETRVSFSSISRIFFLLSTLIISFHSPISIGNETYIKEYQEDGLHSLNPSYPTIRFDENVSVYLIGRVIGILDKDAYPRSEIVEKYKLIHGIDE